MQKLEPHKQMGYELSLIADEHFVFNGKLTQIEQLMHKAITGQNKKYPILLKTLFDQLHPHLFAHFRQEEHQLFTLMQNLPSSLINPETLESMVHQLSNEHELIRKMITHIEELLTKTQTVDPWTQASIDSFVTFLRVHGRKEQTVVNHLLTIIDDPIINSCLKDQYSKLHHNTAEHG